MAIIEVTDLHKIRDLRPKGITTNIEQGEVVVIIGPSEAAKVLLRCLNSCPPREIRLRAT